MRNLFFTIIIVLYVFVFIYLVSTFLKNSASKKLANALIKKDDDKFKKISKSLGGRLINRSGVLDIKLNYYMDQYNHVNIENTIKEISELKLSNSEIKALYPKIFYYYIQRNKDNEAIKYYNVLKDLKYSNKKLVDGIYNAFIEGKADLLDDTLKLIKKADKEDLPIIEGTISKMYENINDNPNAKKYRRLSEKHQKELDIKKR